MTEIPAAALHCRMTDPSFILTAEFDPDSFAWLDGLRREHFPLERNWLPAHLTLFHTLTPAQAQRVCTLSRPAEPLVLSFVGVRFLGRGVAIAVEAPGLALLRAEIVTALGGAVTRQDAQRWQPHVTIQNKVAPDTARALHEAMAAGFTPRHGAATGLLLWNYLGGPWRLDARLPFATETS